MVFASESRIFFERWLKLHVGDHTSMWCALQAETVEERKRLLKQFAQEREAAKRRLMSVGAALQQQALGNSISRGGSPARPRSASAARQDSPGGSRFPAAAQPASNNEREGC
jgi:hypothetical protein